MDDVEGLVLFPVMVHRTGLTRLHEEELPAVSGLRLIRDPALDQSLVLEIVEAEVLHKDLDRGHCHVPACEVLAELLDRLFSLLACEGDGEDLPQLIHAVTHQESWLHRIDVSSGGSEEACSAAGAKRMKYKCLFW